MENIYCSRCSTTIKKRDFFNGKALREGPTFLCPDCVIETGKSAQAKRVGQALAAQKKAKAQAKGQAKAPARSSAQQQEKAAKKLLQSNAETIKKQPAQKPGQSSRLFPREGPEGDTTRVAPRKLGKKKAAGGAAAAAAGIKSRRGKLISNRTDSPGEGNGRAGRKVPPPVRKNQTPLFIGLGVGAVVLIILVMMMMGGNDKPPKVDKPEINTVDNRKEKQLKEAKKLLADAQAYEKQNPGSPHLFLPMFNSAYNMAKLTPLEFDAFEELKRVKGLLVVAAREAFRELEIQILALIEQGKLREARELIRSYPRHFRETEFWTKLLSQMKQSLDRRIRNVIPDKPMGSSTDEEETGSGKYVGNKEYHYYHRPECGQVQFIGTGSRRFFETPDLAEKNNYHPCIDCKPDL